MRNRPRTVHCEEAREGISARLDAERPSLSGQVLDAHLASCSSCREFRARSLDLTRALALRASRPRPEGLLPLLESLSPGSEETGLVVPQRQRRFLASRHDRFRVTRLAATLVPTITACVVLPFGMSVHTRIVPTNQPTPCTAALHHRRSLG
jgi:RNA polymerase sigma-70 factor, ECF subfamily